MSETNNDQSTWLYLKEYPSEEGPNQIYQLIQRVEALEQEIIPKLKDMDNKLEKLIQSHKSLIAYFAVNNSARDLNYKIRSYSSKGSMMPPTGFVPERSNKVEI